ncbi:hypothetical protein H5410_049306 [Solanum commersonii]|uniref:Uncharacterized protein n=1 Tax=Solanum commersonii TaxID=4109 RepID=A0A9J5WTR2_SOLCO|nr:hypothetical protein H5410_049306 [Solanum commersonii]
MDLIHLHSQNSPFTRSNEPRSSYGANWLPRPKRPIYNDKTSLRQGKPPIFLIFGGYSPRYFTVTQNTDSFLPKTYKDLC